MAGLGSLAGLGIQIGSGHIEWLQLALDVFEADSRLVP
jgi:hypothetical protein